jgi:hypothetical protein
MDLPRLRADAALSFTAIGPQPHGGLDKQQAEQILERQEALLQRCDTESDGEPGSDSGPVALNPSRGLIWPPRGFNLRALASFAEPKLKLAKMRSKLDGTVIKNLQAAKLRHSPLLKVARGQETSGPSECTGLDTANASQRCGQHLLPGAPGHLHGVLAVVSLTNELGRPRSIHHRAHDSLNVLT